jgi:hypothetical protein
MYHILSLKETARRSAVWQPLFYSLSLSLSLSKRDSWEGQLSGNLYFILFLSLFQRDSWESQLSASCLQAITRICRNGPKLLGTVCNEEYP